MTQTTTVREPSFKQRLRTVQSYRKRAKEAEALLDQSVVKLRETCPHLQIAVAPGLDGRQLRVCQSCGIQEMDWDSAFTTLTSPGGTWYAKQNDKSRERRKGQHPVLFPMESHKAYSYRIGPHVDVSRK